MRGKNIEEPWGRSPETVHRKVEKSHISLSKNTHKQFLGFFFKLPNVFRSDGCAENTNFTSSKIFFTTQFRLEFFNTVNTDHKTNRSKGKTLTFFERIALSWYVMKVNSRIKFLFRRHCNGVAAITSGKIMKKTVKIGRR